MEAQEQPRIESKPETAVQLIAKVRRYTRKKYYADDKIRVILEGLKREVAVSELCRREGFLHPTMYYNWLKIFMEGGKARLRGDDRRQATAPEVENLRRENERLKMLVADQVLEIQLLKKSLNGSEEIGTTR